MTSALDDYNTQVNRILETATATEVTEDLKMFLRERTRPAGATNGDRVHFGNLPQVEAAQSSAVREEGLVMKVLPFLNTDANGGAMVLGELAFMLPNNSVVTAPGQPNSPIG